MRHYRHYGWAAALLALAAGALPAQAASRFNTEQTLTTFPATLAGHQSARVSLVNLIPPDPVRGIPPDPVKGSVTFYDAAGDALGEPQTFELAAGHSVSIAAPSINGVPITALAAAQPLQLRAVVLTPRNHSSGIHASFEVFDTETLETRFLSPGVIRGFNPQPDPPG